MYKPLTKSKKISLLASFDKLKKVEEKFSFWENNLGFKYIEYLLWLRNPYRFQHHEASKRIHDLQDFQISNKKNDAKVYNTLMLNEYISFCKKSLLNNGIYEVKDRENKFNVEVNNYTDKLAFINDEIRKIDFEIAEKEKEQNIPYNNTSKFFLHGYKEFLLNKNEIDMSVYYGLDNLIALLNGKSLAQYKKYLEELSHNRKNIKAINKPLRIEQQFYLMDYLGILKDITYNENATKIAKFLSLLFSKNDQQIRERVKTFDMRKSNIPAERKKAKEDLEIILPLFEGIGLNEPVTAIKEDIKKLTASVYKKL